MKQELLDKVPSIASRVENRMLLPLNGYVPSAIMNDPSSDKCLISSVLQKWIRLKEVLETASLTSLKHLVNICLI